MSEQETFEREVIFEEHCPKIDRPVFLEKYGDEIYLTFSEDEEEVTQASYNEIFLYQAVIGNIFHRLGFKKALNIGGGLATVSRYLSAIYDIEVDNLELSDVVIKANKFLNNDVKFMQGDINTMDLKILKNYDSIIIDVFQGDYIPVSPERISAMLEYNPNIFMNYMTTGDERNSKILISKRYKYEAIVESDLVSCLRPADFDIFETEYRGNFVLVFGEAGKRCRELLEGRELETGLLLLDKSEILPSSVSLLN